MGLRLPAAFVDFDDLAELHVEARLIPAMAHFNEELMVGGRGARGGRWSGVER